MAPAQCYICTVHEPTGYVCPRCEWQASVLQWTPEEMQAAAERTSNTYHDRILDRCIEIGYLAKASEADIAAWEQEPEPVIPAIPDPQARLDMEAARRNIRLGVS